MSFNKIIIVGNLGRDPELRYTPQGTAVADFSLAVNIRQRDSLGEYQDLTQWYKVTCWGQMGENAAKYLVKGRQVYIDGRLVVEDWTDRDGNPRYTLAVTANDMQFIGDRNGDDGGSGGGTRQYSGGAQGASDADLVSHPPPAADDDDIPF
jgi:single-strand DNA-binding protein